jgi:trehalose 6-phosphate synthase
MIVVSHRGPLTFTEHEDGTFSAARGAGGVASALGPLLRDPEHPPTWIAAAIGDGDRAAVRAGKADDPESNLQLLALDEHEHHLHYDTISNGLLWFLFHGLFDLVRRPRFDARFREEWAAYESVNRAFAERVVELAEPNEQVLVQDYQLALVPAFITERRRDLRIVHFTHTPFCGPNSIRVLPDRAAIALCASLSGCAAGFHTARWKRAFSASAREVLGANADVERTFVASLGPDPVELAAVAASAEAREAGAVIDERVGDRQVILRCDRTEPSKNVVRGFLAFDRLLELRPALRERVTFLAMLNPSRQGLAEYLAYANEVAQAVARVNERWATRDWDPVVLDERDDFARSVAGMQRYDALLVNPLKDGLNLVAKEGPAVNTRDGVLCLSREAGAFDELGSAVEAVHPFDLEQTAGALERALTMPADERAARASELRTLAVARTPGHWLADLVRAAG